MKRSKKYAIINDCQEIYHKIGWFFTRCGANNIFDSNVKMYANRPKGRRLCGNCARSKY